MQTHVSHKLDTDQEKEIHQVAKAAQSRESKNGYAKIRTLRTYYIQSALEYNRSNKGYWDVPGGKNPVIKNGKNIELWEKNGGDDQKFRFKSTTKKGYYGICVSYNRNFNVNVDGGKSKNGTNVELWQSSYSKKRQMFSLYHLGNGTI